MAKNTIKKGGKAKVGQLEFEVKSIYEGSTGKMVSSEYGDFAIELVEAVVEKRYYMPSNGSEGCAFTAHFCNRCKNQNPNTDASPQCLDIFYKSLWDDHVEEWVYNDDGEPVCTAFEFWDWEEGDPPEPGPVDPDQLNLF